MFSFRRWTLNTDYLDDFCLEEEQDAFIDFLLSVATKEQMEQFISSKKIQQRYAEYIFKCDEEMNESDESYDLAVGEE